MNSIDIEKEITERMAKEMSAKIEKEIFNSFTSGTFINPRPTGKPIRKADPRKCYE